MIKNIRKARYETRVMNFMQERHTEEYQLMLSFAKTSESFLGLRDKIINHYYGQRQAGVVFCVESLVLLVDRVLETIEHDVQSSKAA
jgi:hypothetical protein